jgi:hypothetical protein
MKLGDEILSGKAGIFGRFAQDDNGNGISLENVWLPERNPD